MSQSVDWAQVRQDFESDGSLRDIYVLETTEADWQRFLDQLRSSGRPLRFAVDGVTRALPGDVSAVLELRAEASPLLNFEVAGVDFACHFFTASEIEFDFLPNQVQEPARLEGILQFMTELGALLGKTVLLTPENWQRSPIFKYDPATGRTEYCPASAV